MEPAGSGRGMRGPRSRISALRASIRATTLATTLARGQPAARFIADRLFLIAEAMSAAGQIKRRTFRSFNLRCFGLQFEKFKGAAPGRLDHFQILAPQVQKAAAAPPMACRGVALFRRRAARSRPQARSVHAGEVFGGRRGGVGWVERSEP